MGVTDNNLCKSCINHGCEFQSGIVRTECAFYMPPHIEPDRMEMTTTPMSNDEIVENLKTMVFGVQAFERFNAKERETLDRAWNIIDQYENRLKADLKAILVELQLEIEELETSGDVLELAIKDDCKDIIQQKIDKLKEG